MRTIVWRVVRRSLSLASVRYRALLPALSLEARGYQSLIVDAGTGVPVDQADILVFSKSFSIHNIGLAQAARNSQIPVLLDLCDNIFVADYGKAAADRPADVFVELARHANAISCPTTALADIIRKQVGANPPVWVIPDSIETVDLVTRQAQLLERKTPGAAPWHKKLLGLLRSGMTTPGLNAARTTPPVDCAATKPHNEDPATRTIIWFGNHGSPHGDFGLADIVRFAPALERLAREVSCKLVVVSNNAQRFKQLIAPLAIASEYREWSVDVLDQALAQADVAIVPNSRDEFSICKSANRSILSLLAGVPVVATPVPALAPLAGAVWTDDPYEGLSRLLTDRSAAQDALSQAQRAIESNFSLEAVGAQWNALMQSLLSTP